MDSTDNNDTQPPIETIPDSDTVTRMIDFPRMYEPAKSLIWENTFEFPSGNGESVNWAKYVPPPDAVHQLGCQRQRKKQETKPEHRYVGYVPARTGDVRGLQNARGHGFRVEHVPSQGRHHAEIHYAQAADAPLKKADKGELKALLKGVFGQLVPHTCDGIQ